MLWQVKFQDKKILVELPDRIVADQDFHAVLGGKNLKLKWLSAQKSLVICSPDQQGLEQHLKARSFRVQKFSGEAEAQTQLEFGGGTQKLTEFFSASLQRFAPGQEARQSAQANVAKQLRSPMAGKVLKILVKEGETVTAGQLVAVVEAMKMENRIIVQQNGVIKSLKVTEGSNVTSGQTLMSIQ